MTPPSRSPPYSPTMGAADISPGADDTATGLLIIRAWTELGSAHPLRAQVRHATDVGAGFDHVVTLCRADDVTALVSAWLGEFASPAVRGPIGEAERRPSA